MVTKISIDPLTRIEGHLALRLEVENGRVSQAYSSGEMFRGFEKILVGRDPLDAQQITQRICGVCPISHGLASIFAQEAAYGLQPPTNGRLARNLILAANYIQSHIIHFYHLSALDFVDIAAVTQYTGNDPAMRGLRDWVQAQLASKTIFPAAPFLPRYEGRYLEDTELNLMAVNHYLQGLKMRETAQHAGALFCGKMPHATALVPGGITEKITADKIAAYGAILNRLRDFIDHCYIPDVLAVARAFPEYFAIGKGCGNFLAFGVFPENASDSQRFLPSGALINGTLAPVDVGKIREQVRYSFFKSASNLHPTRGATEPDPKKKGDAYSWLKAPRYGDAVMEVGPLARILIAYHHNAPSSVRPIVDSVLKGFDAPVGALDSVLGRHAARAIECKLVADRAVAWLAQLRPGEPSCADFTPPQAGAGAGLTEAPRGALGHWIEIADYKIANYQCVVPTTWNCSPRDDQGRPGAVEQALAQTPVADPKNPLEAARVVRSFDPCIACAVH